MVDAGAPGQTPGRVGPYRIIRRLGAGGMGVVYLGQDETSGQLAAVKLIRPELAANEDFRARLRREVTALQRVPRFCTAPVLAVDTDAQPGWIATEYIEAPTLDVLLVEQGGRLRGAPLEALAVGVAVALRALHEHGVIHRDLKPSNILMSAVGPRVIDFGIARMEDAAAQLTRTGDLLGTLAYVAPEVLEGRPVTKAVDVYAWGCVVTLAGTGRLPFAAGPGGLPSLAATPPDVGDLEEPLRSAVLASLARDPSARPHASELVDRLMAGAPQVATQIVDAAAVAPAAAAGYPSPSPAAAGFGPPPTTFAAPAPPTYAAMPPTYAAPPPASPAVPPTAAVSYSPGAVPTSGAYGSPGPTSGGYGSPGPTSGGYGGAAPTSGYGGATPTSGYGGAPTSGYGGAPPPGGYGGGWTGAGYPQGPPPSGGSKAWLVVVIAVVAAVVLVGGATTAAVLVLRDRSTNDPIADPPTVPTIFDPPTDGPVFPSDPADPPQTPADPPAGGDVFDVSRDPTYGEETAAPGFQPDPFTVELRSGGTVNASYLNGTGTCRGYGAQAPDFRLRWEGGGGLLRFFFLPDSSGDTALVINAPDGSWHCNDDSFTTLNPTVDFENSRPGQYDIWVTTYARPSEFIPGTLHITGNSSLTPSN